MARAEYLACHQVHLWSTRRSKRTNSTFTFGDMGKIYTGSLHRGSASPTARSAIEQERRAKLEAKLATRAHTPSHPVPPTPAAMRCVLETMNRHSSRTNSGCVMKTLRQDCNKSHVMSSLQLHGAEDGKKIAVTIR